MLGRDFPLGGLTIGIEPQRVVPFAKPDKKVAQDLMEDASCLGRLFKQEPDTVACNSVDSSVQQAEVMDEFRGLLGEYEALFTKLPGFTMLIEHSIDRRHQPTLRLSIEHSIDQLCDRRRRATTLEEGDLVLR